MQDLQTNEQLKDITIVIASVEYDDDGNAYAITQRFCGDLEGPIEDFIEKIEEIKQLIHLDKMRADFR